MPVYRKIRAERVLLQALTAVLLAEFPHNNLTNFRENQLNPISSRSWQNSSTFNLTTKFKPDPFSTELWVLLGRSSFLVFFSHLSCAHSLFYHAHFSSESRISAGAAFNDSPRWTFAPTVPRALHIKVL
ncbi:hypothetical protein Y032_0370g92 [Ancylostoma ceylanicum]|uniref:Uncharacterized protein n=1 Tax=Ancylostoma ceylanicum TaxID=53326 RepID=A0A016RUJ9_9BILA|nr:hypothetical protein Y032_0370g92 [Ancylostoma ceylanicum]